MNSPDRRQTDSGGIAHTASRSIARAISARSPLPDTLNLIAREAMACVSAGSSILAMRVESGLVLETLAAAGANEQELRGLRVPCESSLAEEVIRTGQPRLLEGRTDPDPLAPGFRNAAVVPTVRDGSITGVLIALNRQGAERFVEADLGALAVLADQVTLAQSMDDCARHFAQKEREAAILYDAARTVSGSLNVQEVVNSLLDIVTERFNHQAAVLFLLNDERTHLFISADRGLSEDDREIQLAADGLVTARALESQTPLLIHDSFSELAYESVAAPGRSRSAVVAPVRSRHDALGLLIVSTAQPDAYSEGDVELLGAIAAQAGIAITNAWLYEDAMRRAEEAGALYDLSQHVSATLHLDRVLHFVADSVLGLLKVDKFALMLLDPREERLQARVVRGLDEERFAAVRPRRGEGIPGWVMEWLTPTAVSDVAADARNGTYPLHTEGVVSTVCVPMAVGTDEIGVMLAMSSRRRLFTVAEMELLYTIANQAAVAIANATLFQDARSKSAEMRRYFHRIARALGSALESQDASQLLADLMVEVMHADRCAIYRTDGENMRIQAISRFKATSPPDPAVPVGEGLAGWVGRRGKPLAIENLADDPRARYHTWLARERLASYLAIPLKAGRKTVGVVEIYSQEPRRFVEEEIKLLAQFARRARVAERLAADGA